MTPIKILLIEDNLSDAHLVETMLSGKRVDFPLTLTRSDRLSEGIKRLREQTFDVVITDLGLPDSQGLNAVEQLQKHARQLPIIVLTRDGDLETALAAIKAGAQDYLPKGQLGSLLLARTIRHAIERQRAKAEQAAGENLLRLFIARAPAAIAILDSEMRYLQVSDRWLASFQVDNTIIGRSHYEVFPNLPQRWKDGHKRVLAGAVEKSDEDEGPPRADGSFDWLQWEIHPWRKSNGEVGGLIFFVQIITERKERELEREKMIRELQAALAEVKTLSGLLPICASCKKVRDDRGYWSQIETYIAKHTTASFSHGLCPECGGKFLKEAGIERSPKRS
jgi:PAS domain S-box-containing protein